VVPVGLTKYKNDELRTYTQKEAQRVIKQIKKWQEILLDKFGENFLYASDEFYLLTDNKIPEYSHYNDFPQLENGVGLTRLFREEYKNIKGGYLDILNKENINRDKYTIITSVLGKKAIKPVIDDINQKQDSVKIEIAVVKNDFFGESVTVTGLLTAVDIENKLKNIDSKNIILPSVLLNDNNKFIDEVKIDEFKKRFVNKKIYLCNDIKDIMEVLVDVKTSSSNSR
jgi:NifB/MoaA-like Fe-S oxidoreductase